MSEIKKIDKVMLFVDLHNFSIASVHLGDRTPEFVQAYYVLVGDIVVPTGGMLIKYMGDAVFAVFEAGAVQGPTAPSAIQAFG